MSDLFDQRLRDLLRKIIRRSGQKISSGAIIREFQKESVHPSILHQFSELIKYDTLALNLFESDHETNITNLQTQDPEKWLITFLDKYFMKMTLYKEIHQASKKKNCTSLSTEDEIESTKISDILKKVKAATVEYQAPRDSIEANIRKKFFVDESRPHSLLYPNKVTHDILPIGSKVINCAALPISRQEQLVIEDLIYCFIGIPGDYIIPHFSVESENGFTPIRFKISEQIDVSLRNIVQDILPMASHYSVVQKFAQWSSKANNQILQAFSEVLQSILNDYRVSITQLEKEQLKNILNLHKLLYLIRPNMQTLHILAELIGKVISSNLQGGSILSLLFDEITLQTGDSMSQKMLIELTERASMPYIEMLERWILKGVIIDPYNQFFIIDNGLELGNKDVLHMDDYDTARYWEYQYTIASDRIPRFLENDRNIILRTGKYLNVIRHCGKQISPPACNSTLEFLAMTHNHTMFIKQAYYNASKTLLELFLNENNLMGHITSVKRYFLLQQGDLITQFMEASEDELSKNVDKVTPVRLDNLLQLIVRLSSAKNDPCLECLHCDLFTMDLTRQMSKIHEVGNYDTLDSQLNGAGDMAKDANSLDLTGLECFTFKYSVHWPLSIVLNQYILSQYQMLFRLLFYCKHVDRQLCKVWIQNIEICKNNAKIEKDQWRTAFALRQRMLNAIQHLEYYMMIEIIEPNWHIFTEKMKSVHNIDDVITIHQDFLHVCLQSCMLQHPHLLKSLMKICGVCLRFCKIIRNETTDIESIGKEFNDLLVAFIKALGVQSSDTTSTPKFVSLVCRLNFNSFYN